MAGRSFDGAALTLFVARACASSSVEMSAEATAASDPCAALAPPPSSSTAQQQKTLLLFHHSSEEEENETKRSPSRDSVITNLSLLSLSSYASSGMSKSTVTGGSSSSSAATAAASASQIIVLPPPTVVKGTSSIAQLLTSGDGGGKNSCGDDIEEETEEEDGLVAEDDDDDEEEENSTRGPSPCCLTVQHPSSVNVTAAGRTGSVRGSGRHNLQVPSEHYGLFGRNRSSGGGVICSLSETLFEEESDLIRSCGALSSVLGVRKSFSTSDISQATSGDDLIKTSASEVLLCGGTTTSAAATCRDDFSTHGCLDYSSRSCSTWVAVGDMASTSQLPSPQGNPGQVSDTPTITAAEFVRSVNKKVRQTYIKRRLLTTYKALERIAQSELNLQACKCELAFMGKISKSQVSREILKLLRKDFDPHGPGLLEAARSFSLTVRDVENEKGKPLTKYERNMMIFNWLHTLEDNAYDRLA